MLFCYLSLLISNYTNVVWSGNVYVASDHGDYDLEELNTDIPLPSQMETLCPCGWGNTVDRCHVNEMSSAISVRHLNTLNLRRQQNSHDDLVNTIVPGGSQLWV